MFALARFIASLFRSSPAPVPVVQPAPVAATVAPLEREVQPSTTIVLSAAPKIPPAAVAAVLVAKPVDTAVKPVAPASDWLTLCTPVVQHFESCRLKAYPDPASPLAKALQAAGLWQQVLGGAPIPAGPHFGGLSGAPWTCGWGCTGDDVGPDTVWTQATADARLVRSLNGAAGILDSVVHVPLTPAQKGALVSLVYNVGPGRAEAPGVAGRDGIVVLANGQPSTLLRRLNAGDYAGAAAQILVWDRAAGRVLDGLEKRRAAEQKLFLTGEWK